MSSSISISDARRWRRLLVAYALACVGLGLALAGGLLALDPYDTGRFALVASPGVADFGQRLAFAGIARRPGIDTAIFGNSTIQLLDPRRISELTGRTAVSLAVPGTGPLEQLAIARWFVRHHAQDALTLVFGIDASWCTTQNPIPMTNPFPFWLYGDSRLDYARGMMRFKSFEAAWRKLELLAGRGRAARADGYHDYDTGRAWHGLESPEDAPGAVAAATPGEFTAPPRLRGFLQHLPARDRVVLVIVPRHESALPPEGSAAAETVGACKQAYRDIAANRPETRLLDFLVDDAMARHDENFWDQIHYRKPVARAIEDRLARALGGEP